MSFGMPIFIFIDLFNASNYIYIYIWVVVYFTVMNCIRLYCVVSIALKLFFYWLYCTDIMPINRTIKSDCGLFHTLCFYFGPQRHMRHIWFPPFKYWWGWDRVSVSGDFRETFREFLTISKQWSYFDICNYIYRYIISLYGFIFTS